MTYKITKRQLQNAEKLGVQIRPSKKAGKKIDVYKGGKLVASIGAIGYADYDIFLASGNKSFADKRRRLYKLRHNRHRNIKGSPSYYADRILW